MIGSLQNIRVEAGCHFRRHCLTQRSHLYQLLVYGMLDFVPKAAAPHLIGDVLIEIAS